VKYPLTIVVFAALGTSVPVHADADSTPRNDLSTQCQAMAFLAHPASLPDMPAVTNLRHSYYTLCVGRHGIMDPELNNQ
jgi:hypothetical protein